MPPTTVASVTPDPDLSALRERIDQLDRELLRVLAERLQVCHEVARIKEKSDTPVIQPARVRDVVTSRRQWAIDAGVDPDFAEQVMRVLLAETHRIEVAGRRDDAAPDKSASPTGARSDLDTVATRIDHIVVAVDDLPSAVALFTDRLGFHRPPLAQPVDTPGMPANPGIAVLDAGGVTIVLVGPEAGADVAQHLRTHGPGIHHIAVEVLNAGYARQSLAGGSASLLTDVVVDDDGHEQFFTVRDPTTGVQIGFISRTGHRVGVATANILEAFRNPSSK